MEPSTYNLPPSNSNDNEVLVKVSGVSKKFCRDLKKSLWYGIKDVASELLPVQNSKSEIHNSDSLRPGEFWANKDISFELRRGECLGLIGHNGAGKTTLLKTLNGLIKPDSGTIEMRGRVGALIALGAGFNPILTGRENIYVNGSILGLTKAEIDSKIESIIDFAEIPNFIDSPVQSYSSGMQVRLGFAVATALDPDILILDEVLAVGDVGFRTKCYNRIFEICKTSAVIFVSHSMPQISRLCNRTLLLDHGELHCLGKPTLAIDQYNNLVNKTNPQIQSKQGVQVNNFLINNSSAAVTNIVGGSDLKLQFESQIPQDHNDLEINLSFEEPSLGLVSWLNNTTQKQSIKNTGRKTHHTVIIPNLNFGSGPKQLSITIRDAESNEILFWNPDLVRLQVTNDPYIPAPLTHKAQFSSRDA